MHTTARSLCSEQIEVNSSRDFSIPVCERGSTIEQRRWNGQPIWGREEQKHVKSAAHTLKVTAGRFIMFFSYVPAVPQAPSQSCTNLVHQNIRDPTNVQKDFVFLGHQSDVTASSKPLPSSHLDCLIQYCLPKTWPVKCDGVFRHT